ncbi:hypothetical protein EV424DRAFT_1349529 [Suillus variegatus]|nr:hypothetical protein EV424DRAFT_1349529 [Suillus variegatus]
MPAIPYISISGIGQHTSITSSFPPKHSRLQHVRHVAESPYLQFYASTIVYSLCVKSHLHKCPKIWGRVHRNIRIYHIAVQKPITQQTITPIGDTSTAEVYDIFNWNGP